MPGCGQEIDSCHPFFGAEAGFAREVVEVGDEALHDVFHAWVWVVGVGDDGVFGDVVDGQVHHGGDFRRSGIHLGEMVEEVFLATDVGKIWLLWLIVSTLPVCTSAGDYIFSYRRGYNDRNQMTSL